MNRTYRLANGDPLVEMEIARSLHWRLDAESRRFALSDGSWIEPRTFVLIDPGENVIAYYGHPSRDYALDDYLYILDVHDVRNGALYCSMIEIGGLPGHFTVQLCQERIELEGLEVRKCNVPDIKIPIYPTLPLTCPRVGCFHDHIEGLYWSSIESGKSSGRIFPVDRKNTVCI